MHCPGCGQALEVDGRQARFVVCDSCDSSVVLDAAATLIAGRMGALRPPEGLLYRGARGQVMGRSFTVLGRARYGYSRGVWDEWFLGFEDGSQAWVSEDEGELELESCAEVEDVGFSHQGVAPGDVLTIAGRRFRVDEKDVATCEGGEGQLPFPVIHGARIPYVELASEGAFATVEFDPQQGVRIFRGRKLRPDEVTLERSREEAGIGPEVVGAAMSADARERVVLGQGEQKTVNCDGCAAPLTVPSAGAESHECEFCGEVIDLRLERKVCASCERTLPVRSRETRAASCPFCHALLDVGSDTTKLLLGLSGARPNLPLEPGMKGKIRGVEVEVLGHMRYVDRSGGRTWHSNEFYLRRGGGEYSWLVRDGDSVWWQKQNVDGPENVNPRRMHEGQTVVFKGQAFTVDEVGSKGDEVLDWVEGEFTWVPQVGDTGGYMDALDYGESRMLGAEWTDQELEWTVSERVAEARVLSWFGIQPESTGPVSSLPAGSELAARLASAGGGSRRSSPGASSLGSSSSGGFGSGGGHIELPSWLADLLVKAFFVGIFFFFCMIFYSCGSPLASSGYHGSRSGYHRSRSGFGGGGWSYGK